jgi:two-component system, sensor histidine kinase and response regulator
LQTLRRWLPRRHDRIEKVDVVHPARESAASLEGIDVAGSLERLGLEFESFQRMLIRFADSQGATLEALRSAVASSDSAAVARHAHAIAGAAGNLGADGLRAAAKALEHAGREGRTDLGALVADLEARANIVFRSIDTLRATDQPVPAPAGLLSISPDARAALERLQTALGDYDLSAASSALADLDRAAMPGPAAEMTQLRNHVDSYEYDEARALATRLLEQIGSETP